MRTAALFLALALAACVGPTYVVQQYEGPVRPKDTIATLRVDGDDSSVVLAALDGEPLGGPPLATDSRLHIELLPGRHELRAGDEPLAFQAEAGKVYRIVRTPAARVFEVDRGSDKPLRDVTAP